MNAGMIGELNPNGSVKKWPVLGIDGRPFNRGGGGGFTTHPVDKGYFVVIPAGCAMPDMEALIGLFRARFADESPVDMNEFLQAAQPLADFLEAAEGKDEQTD